MASVLARSLALWLTAAPPLVPATTSIPTPEAMQVTAEAALAAARAAERTAEAVRELAKRIDELEDDLPDEMPPETPLRYLLNFEASSDSGNSSQFKGNLALQVDGTFGAWSMRARTEGAYGQTQQSQTANGVTTTADVVSVFNAGALLRGDRAYTPFLGNFVQGRVFTDRKASIRLRTTAEVGLNFVWWEVKRGDFLKTRLSTSLGFRAIHEDLHQYYPVPQNQLPRWIFGPPLALDFLYALNKQASFRQTFDILAALAEPRERKDLETPAMSLRPDLRVESVSTLAASLTEVITLTASFTLRYISDPAPGKKTTDTSLSAGVNFKF